ncbi:hypothetical protein B0T18DRAFT_415882 [Schizothecium vesticola]|uniref:Uncharacterized protein n=1 Tax=Schizothecium vesticola TaxID=314040 RepID=A0AA40K2Y8_9PEZI|nr:hypothetical protein B0T18DRAFT_415882 [Schizothecium vesticola]
MILGFGFLASGPWHGPAHWRSEADFALGPGFSAFPGCSMLQGIERLGKADSLRL